ncbi:MAG: YeeE/YedE family protein [Methanomicrobia archaeon]|nr:YeeE/YedE family protein [Methanomicrobia archaeon]
MEYLMLERWSPYIVGIGIGILSWFAFLLSDKAIGCSTAYARTSGMIERLVRGNKVLEKQYYKKFAPVVDWEWMLVLGVVIGAFISANLGGTFHVLWVPSLWAASFGTNPVLRWLVALIGGILMGLGARWAGGCTSGHGISGTLQLAVSSWLAAICFFIGGIATAMLIFYVIG